MYYVYILKSINFPKEIYKGHTSNLKKRIVKHNSGSVKHTSKFKPWKLIFYCAFEDKKKAVAFEKYLKTASGIAFMRKRLT
jgi:predicted GIY-YIG superfamily endonuclease